MNPAKTVPIVLSGETRQLKFNHAALRKLGLRGPLDGEAWDRAWSPAAESFEDLARLLSIGLAHEKRNDTEATVLDALENEQTDIPPYVELLKAVTRATFGDDIFDRAEGFANGRPPEAQTGERPGPAPSSTSASPAAGSGD